MAEETPDEKLNETLESLSERLRERNDAEMKTMEGRKKDQSHLTLKTIAKAVLDIRQIMVLQALADKRDIEGSEDKSPPGKKEEKKDDLKLESVGPTFFEIAAALTGAVAGLVAGFVAGIGKFFTAISKLFMKPETIEKISKSWNKVTAGIKGFFKSIETFFTKSIKSVKKFFTAAAEESVFLKNTKKFFGSISKLFQGIIAPVKAAFAPLTSAGKIAKDMNRIFKSFVKFFKPMGELLGKFFAPIYIGIELIVDAFKIFGDDTKTLGEKFTTFLFDIPKVIGNFFLEIPEMIKKGISWLFEKLVGPENPITKFLDSFSFTEMWSNAIDGLQKLFESPKETYDAMVKSIDESIHAAIVWVKNVDFTEMILRGLANLADIGEKIIEGIQDAITGAVEWVTSFDFSFVTTAFAKIGEIATSISDMVGKSIKSAINYITKIDVGEMLSDFLETLKNDPEKGILSLLSLPAKLVQSAVSWLLGKLGFDLVSQDLKEMDVESMVKGVIMAPINLMKLAVEMLTGFISSAVDWVKGKLSFFSKDSKDEEPMELTGQESVDQLVETGVVRNTGRFDPRTAKIDESQIDNLSNEQLDAIAAEYPNYQELQEQIKAEKTSRVTGSTAQTSGTIETPKAESTPQKTPGTIQSAVQPPPVVNEVDAAYATPAQITGLAQESVAQSDELMVTQQQLDTNRQQAAAPLAGAGNSQVGIDASTSSVTNVTNYIPAKQPSSRDQTDQMYIFRATGNSR